MKFHTIALNIFYLLYGINSLLRSESFRINTIPNKAITYGVSPIHRSSISLNTPSRSHKVFAISKPTIYYSFFQTIGNVKGRLNFRCISDLLNRCKTDLRNLFERDVKVLKFSALLWNACDIYDIATYIGALSLAVISSIISAKRIRYSGYLFDAAVYKAHGNTDRNVEIIRNAFQNMNTSLKRFIEQLDQIGPTSTISNLWKKYESKLKHLVQKFTILRELNIKIPKGFLQYVNIKTQAENPNKINDDIMSLFLLTSTFTIFEGLLVITKVALTRLSHERLVIALQKFLFRKVIRQDIKYFDEASHGKITSRLIHETEEIPDFLVSCISKLFSGTIQAFSAISILNGSHNTNLSSSVVSTIVTVSAFILSSITDKLINRSSAGAKQNDCLAAVNSIASGSFKDIQNVQLNCAEDFEIHRYDESQKRYFSSVRTTVLAWMNERCIKRTLFRLMDISNLYLGIRSLSKGVQALGDVIASRAAIRRLYGGLEDISDTLSEARRTAVSCQRYMQLVEDAKLSMQSKQSLDNKRFPALDSSPIYTKPASADIVFDNVTFKYGDKSQILPGVNKFNLKIAPGSYVGIVGESGAGKSTIAKLIQRLYDPQVGRILINGRDIREMDIRYLRSIISSVNNPPVIIPGSVALNIAYGDAEMRMKLTQTSKPSAIEQSTLTENIIPASLVNLMRTNNLSIQDSSRILEAAKLAQIHDMIVELPNGYSTELGTGEQELSSGQIQRLAIARAILRKPAICIFDEATSSVDRKTEAKLISTLHHLKKQCTLIVIAHRLATVRNADIIIVMDKGNIHEVGTHEELLRNQNSLYKKLVSSFSNTLHSD